MGVLRFLTYGLRLCIIALCLLAASCKKDLNTSLSEHEANEILAVLLENDVDAQKVLVSENLVNIQVEESDMLRAIKILERFASRRRF